MKTQKPAPNTTTLQTLKDEGWKINIRHFRMALSCWFGQRWKIYPEKDLRLPTGEIDPWYELSPTGGATEMDFIHGDEKITVRATCYHKDAFCRRLGVKVCLDKFFNERKRKWKKKMSLYEIVAEYRTVVCAESEKDALSGVDYTIRHLSDDQPISVGAERIESLSDLPSYWKESYIPWGSNDDGASTREILDNAEN